ncbi:hypothetical protein HOL63_04545 [Candidatus Peregrinibacteria bacterium]|nr:hypothetical protein [Candidatus Peregrinibacteria bacterium]MBT5468804.1 hypothetical protein [Candidatus Peregrinibacteria bacterium]MBT7337312.1 hypothetical protein [Candidatus Peregrinibacteria bacterium]
MINKIGSNHRLDYHQISLHEDFRTSSQMLVDIRQETVERMRVDSNLEEPERTRIAGRAEELIQSLEEIALEAAESIHLMSTPEGEVDALQSTDYLQQELVRTGILIRLKEWKSRHDLHAKHISRESGGKVDTGSSEKSVYEIIVRNLREDLSGLSEESECFRALLIIKEIQNRRGVMSLTFLATPVSSIRNLTATVVSSAIFFGVTTGVTLGVASTGIQYASNGIDKWTMSQKLSVPEKNALDTIYAYEKKDRGMLILLMAKAGVSGNIEDLLSARASA